MATIGLEMRGRGNGISGDVAMGTGRLTGIRHGSGAAGTQDPNLRAPRRGRRTPSPSRRSFMPGGPITATEWDDQVQQLQGQIYTLNKTLNDHAHAIGQLKSELGSTTIPTIIQRIQLIETSVDSRFETYDKRLIDGGNKVNERLQTLSSEIRALATGHDRPPPVELVFRPSNAAPAPPPGVGPEHYDVSSPPPRTEGLHNPWAHLVNQHGGAQAAAFPSTLPANNAMPQPATGAPAWVGGNQPGGTQPAGDFGVHSPISSYGSPVVGNAGVNHPPNVQFGQGVGQSGVGNNGNHWLSTHHRNVQHSYNSVQAPLVELLRQPRLPDLQEGRQRPADLQWGPLEVFALEEQTDR